LTAGSNLLAGTLGPGPAANRLELAGFPSQAELQLFAVTGQGGPPDDAAVARALYGSGSPHLLLSLGELFVLGLAQAETEQALLDVGAVRVGASRPFTAGGRFDDDRDVGWLPSDAASQREVVDRILGPAIAYDAAHGSELVRSLEVWLEHDRSAQRTAHVLHVHPHTSAYRLRRLQQLTGRDLSRTPDTVDVWLALRARRLLDREAVSAATARSRPAR
jgi:PucR family transcriptional regulator, purine catabolism regulatory protein